MLAQLLDIFIDDLSLSSGDLEEVRAELNEVMHQHPDLAELLDLPSGTCEIGDVERVIELAWSEPSLGELRAVLVKQWIVGTDSSSKSHRMVAPGDFQNYLKRSPSTGRKCVLGPHGSASIST